MSRLHRFTLTIAATAVLLAALPVPALAMTSKGMSMRGWSPHGGAPKSGYTKLLIQWSSDQKITFYLSNRATHCYLMLAYPPAYARVTRRVSRNAFFKAVRTNVVGTNVDLTWTWRRVGGKRVRYLTGVLATNLMNDQ